MYNDLWNSSAFDLIEMTNHINLLRRQGDDIAAHIPFEETAVYTNDFALDVTRRDQVSLVPVSDLGAPGDILPDDEQADARRFTIPSYVRRATLRNFEVMGARIPGGNSLRILETERNKKLARLRAIFDETKAYQRWTSLFGKVMAFDVKGAPKLLLDTCRELGLKRTRLVIKTNDSKNSINDQLVDAKVRIERTLGFAPRSYKLIVTEGPHSKLRKHDEIKALNTAQTAIRLASGDLRSKPIVIADNVEIIYFQNPRIDETKSLLVPIFDDCARTVNGPSISSDFEGNVLPLYVQKKLLDWNEGVEFKASMRSISFMTRPDSIYEVDFSEA